MHQTNDIKCDYKLITTKNESSYFFSQILCGHGCQAEGCSKHAYYCLHPSKTPIYCTVHRKNASLKSGDCVLCKVHQKNLIFPQKSRMFPKDTCIKVGRMCSVQGTSLWTHICAFNHVSNHQYIFRAKLPKISAKEPCTSPKSRVQRPVIPQRALPCCKRTVCCRKEPFITAEELCIYMEEPYTLKRKPCIATHKRCIFTKSPLLPQRAYIAAKEPCY